jgi:hypothetical protein
MQPGAGAVFLQAYEAYPGDFERRSKNPVKATIRRDGVLENVIYYVRRASIEYAWLTFSASRGQKLVRNNLDEITSTSHRFAHHREQRSHPKRDNPERYHDQRLQQATTRRRAPVLSQSTRQQVQRRATSTSSPASSKSGNRRSSMGSRRSYASPRLSTTS